MKNIIYYISISGIIVLSFFLYSSNFYPLLGSDDAIQVLMIHDFKLPHDLYFWGQDRYGSLIPLLGQPLYRGLGLSPLTSESIAHYLLLVAGYFAFAGLLKARFSRFALAVIWFFPPIRLIDLLRLNIGEEYSLLAIGIFLIIKMYEVPFEKYRLKQHLLLLSITFLFILAAWVSDLAALSAVLIVAVQVYFGSGQKRVPTKKAFRWRWELCYGITGSLLGAAFILYGKHFAMKSPLYNNFNDLNTVVSSLRLFGDSMRELLLFKASEPFTSAYLYLVLVLAGALLLMRRHIHFPLNERKWLYFFILDFILLFCLIMLSKWAYMNGVPRRYFTSSYITFWMAFLLIFEYLSASEVKKWLQAAMMIAVVTAGLGSVYNLKYIWPKTLKPRIEYVREFESLGKIGIIGDYWNSYINSASNPDQIVATPNDRSSVRNRDMAYKVMERDTLYVIRDGWMDAFPDSLNQFGTPIYKNGDEFRMGDCYVCRYRK